jgi:DNA invertase Pin-like site-specific DNA recombinase
VTIKVASYIRMSTDEQANSPERQRTQITAHCAQRGYRLVAEYADLGLRGTDGTRPEFNRLLADALSGQFEVVVVDEQSRLARNDPVDFIAQVVHPLRKAGVRIDTVAKGVLDWDDLGGFIVGAVSQHTASGEVVTLSRRVVTELARKALTGDLVAGKPPYGYEQVWKDRKGTVVHRGKRTWTKRPTGWEPHWEVKEEEAEVVRSIFRSYVAEDQSLRSVAEGLAKQGVRTPRGGDNWSRSHLRNILTNRAYVGEWVFNRVSAGSFHKLSWQEVGEGRIGVAKQKKRKADRRTVTPNDEADWVVIADHHPPLVDRATFERAGELLKGNRVRCRPAASRVDYPLAQLLHCDHCGSRFVGDRDRSGKFYLCGGYASYGPSKCRPYRIREDDMLGLLETDLTHRFLEAASVKKLLQQAEREKNSTANQSDTERLRKKVATLAATIGKANRNLLLLDEERVVAAQEQLRELERELSDLKGELRRRERADPVAAATTLIQGMAALLKGFRAAIRRLDYNSLRQGLRQEITRIDLRFKTDNKKVRSLHRLVGGRTTFCSGGSYDWEVVLVQNGSSN